jgi:hypothetical protein
VAWSDVAWSDAAQDDTGDAPVVSDGDLGLLESALGIDDATTDPTASP